MPSLYLKLASHVLVAILAFGMGWKVESWKRDSQDLAQLEADQKAIQASVEQSKRIIAERQSRIETAALLEIERTRTARVVERVITNDVIKYVQTPFAAKCCLDPAGLRIINSAASGMPADTSTAIPSDAGTTTITVAQVVASVTENYLTCAETRNQLIALQDWVRAIR